MPIFNRSTSNVHLLSWGHYKRCSHSSRIVILAEVQCGGELVAYIWRFPTRPRKVTLIIDTNYLFLLESVPFIECHLNKLPKKEPECSYSWFDYDFTFLCFVKPQVSINITLTPPLLPAACSEETPSWAWQEQRNLKVPTNKKSCLKTIWPNHWHMPLFMAKKQTNLIKIFLLCSVSFFRWLCLRLLWLPRVCYIDHPNLLNQTKCRERWANFSVPATWTPITPPGEINCPFAYPLRLMSQRLERWEASECMLPLVTFHTLCQPWDVPGHLDMPKATGTLSQ